MQMIVNVDFEIFFPWKLKLSLSLAKHVKFEVAFPSQMLWKDCAN